ncbi:hypothetical protein AB0H58_32515 [Nocardia neocaledoniensis]|uniref:hypothetical protein n=1 Tax=Nocardia neocaledoniensis TaxID=236511 RepID=UPI0033F9A657
MTRDEWGNFWFPRDVDRKARPTPGCLVAWMYQPWRLISMTHDEQNRMVVTYVLRPLHVNPEIATHEQDEHLVGSPSAFDVLNEHYGLCVHCNELLPCRTSIAEQMAIRAAARMQRYETAGICPECQEPVTHRQESETFPNVVSPLGPPVTFHAGRRACRYAMEQYRDGLGQQPAQLRLDGGKP